ncbi:hypothetical protein IQ254_17860 [Nodosilinea sp. LEGE 07088]|uniref:hypothetical protein n=1 Tax=Nodosilinea sp. LEGE 07088 TaxID=2777968 RepID=UPI001880A8D1|nr:hypothetical protein [Nodosilinea sp. LEGE 07088]MBE9139036.1 hypothetical protein [Nodosilinea sp. LEGE 07088]
MEFLYCFANASLTQRILDYLLRQVPAESVTVIFLNDRWVLHIKLNSATDPERCDDCWAFLNENGFPYHPSPSVALALHELEAGYSPIQVMNRCHVSIVSHGHPQPGEVDCFQEKFVAGLGYCPQSLG